jgi:N-acetylneuraminate synthase/sialic acid synthase
MAEAAYLMGARIIEKHFTLNHTWKGTDHALSLEPQGFESMVKNIKRLKLAIGNGSRPILPAEAAPIRKMAKSVHVNRFIPAGKQIDVEDIALKSPADGIPAYEYGNVLGKIAINDLSTANALTWEDME